MIIFGTVVFFTFISFLPYAYAACVATILPQPCFDSFMKSHDPMTEKSIMERFTASLEINYDSWEMSDRDWSQEDAKLKLPAIICTEFVANGITEYRMTKWEDPFTISSFEDHRNDWMCNKWLPPAVFEYEIKWDKRRYLPEGTNTYSN